MQHNPILVAKVIYQDIVDKYDTLQVGCNTFQQAIDSELTLAR